MSEPKPEYRHGGKRPGAGRKSLKEHYGENVIELTIRLTQSQYNHVSGQEMSAAAYLRHLIDQDISHTP
jgi:hypothetical protein